MICREQQALQNFRDQVDKFKTKKEIAEKIDCDSSVISNHYNGKREMSIDMLLEYADVFNVSTDYLLGLTTNPTTDVDIRALCDRTGLDMKAVQCLEKLKRDNLNDANNYLNRYIQFFSDMMVGYYDGAVESSALCRSCITRLSASKEEYAKITGTEIKTHDDYYFKIDEEIKVFDRVANMGMGNLYALTNLFNQFNEHETGFFNNEIDMKKIRDWTKKQRTSAIKKHYREQGNKNKTDQK